MPDPFHPPHPSHLTSSASHQTGPLSGPTVMISTQLRTLCLAMLAMPAMAGDGLFKDITVYDALAQARRSNQVVLVSWTRPDDPACKRMSSTWSKAEVVEWVNRNAIAVEIDGNKERRQAQNWQVKSYPSVILIQPDGTVILRAVGFQMAEQMVVELEAAVRAAKAGVDGSTLRPSDDTVNDPQAWLTYANALFAKGETDASDCLNAYLWCIDNGDAQSPGFLDRYLELILRRLITLDKVAPAREALRQRSHQYARAVASGYGTPESLRVLMSIGRHLGELGEAIRVFDSIRMAENPDEALLEVALNGVVGTLIGRKRYEDVLSAAGDMVGKARVEGARLSAASASHGDGAVSSVLMDERRKYVELNGFYYQALLGVGRGADAKALAEVVLEHVSTGNAYSSFIGHAKRLDLQKVADQLCAVGLKNVASKKGKKMIERAAKATKIGLSRTARNDDANRNSKTNDE